MLEFVFFVDVWWSIGWVLRRFQSAGRVALSLDRLTRERHLSRFSLCLCTCINQVISGSLASIRLVIALGLWSVVGVGFHLRLVPVVDEGLHEIRLPTRSLRDATS